jgi:hypothetical protein
MNNKKEKICFQPKRFRNLFYETILLIRYGVKNMRSTEFYSIITILILGTALIITPIVLSYLTANITIQNKGKILPLTDAPIIYQSEIRGVHIIDAVMSFPHDWNVIAETLSNYKINFVTILLMGLPTRRAPDSEWRAAIQAFHSRGIEVWISYHVVGEMAVKEEYKCVRSDGSLDNWNCPSNPNFRQEVKANVEYVARNYDIDGIMFDYARYQYSDECYCPHCKAAFEDWLNETIPDSNWPPNPSDFGPGGSRRNEFMDWRTIPISNLIRDVRNWMLAINPNLKFGLAQWTLFGYPSRNQYYPQYWRYWIGQDTAYWVKEGYIDITMPMMYNEPATGEPHSIEADLLANWEYITGGKEGKIPLIAFINTGNMYKKTARDPQEVKACIDKAREMGADGWILWCYGGPGINDNGWHIDIRPYLDLIDMPGTFSIRNIDVSITGSQATISWITDLPATSKVEYSTTNMFTATKRRWSDFWIWDVDHIEGTIIENTTMVTNHSITITGLTPDQMYYFRIQSRNENGMATTDILTFTVSPYS